MATQHGRSRPPPQDSQIPPCCQVNSESGRSGPLGGSVLNNIARPFEIQFDLNARAPLISSDRKPSSFSPTLYASLTMHRLLLFWIFMVFYCVGTCGRDFASKQALHIHQDSCDALTKANAVAAREAQSAPDSRALYVARQRAKKRPRTDEELPEASTSQSGPSLTTVESTSQAVHFAFSPFSLLIF